MSAPGTARGTRSAINAQAIVARVGLALAVLLPLGIAATSPLLAWREPIYIVAGFAGVLALGLLLVQPVLIGTAWLRLDARTARRAHRLLGIALLILIALHIVGLWITSPPDVLDALLLRSPTPFSLWGVIAMWTAIMAALLAALRRRVSVTAWRLGHTALVASTVTGTAIHAWLIDGTMGTVSKGVLCALAIAATTVAVVRRKAWRRLVMRSSRSDVTDA